MLHRYFINLSFVGTGFHGWQIQKNACTIQGEINKALSILLKEKINTIGCGRTDTGVHAIDFYAHFDTKHTISTISNNKNIDKKKFLHALNALVGNNICIKDIFKVSDNQHARFSAINRTYLYKFHYLKNPFLNNFSLELKKPVDIELANRACQNLIGTNDFYLFTKRQAEQTGTICTIYSAYLQKNNDNLYFYITANKFLWNMVRRIVDIILKISYKVYPVEIVSQLLRHICLNIPFSISPCYGLYLYKINYSFK